MIETRPEDLLADWATNTRDADATKDGICVISFISSYFPWTVARKYVTSVQFLNWYINISTYVYDIYWYIPSIIITRYM